MDNYNTCSFVITHSITNTVISRTPFYGTEPSTLPLLPQGAHENEGFHLKRLLSTKNVLSLTWNLVPNHSVRENTAEYLSCSRWLNAFLGPYFFTFILKSTAGSVSKATPMGVPAPLKSISVSEGKVMGWRGAGLGQSKQRGSQHSK